MRNWWNWLLIAGLISFLVFIIAMINRSHPTKEELRNMFDDYIEKFNKTYKNNVTLYETRFEHFVVNIIEIDKLNSEARGPQSHKACYGLTNLTDMSKEEFKDIRLSDEIPHRRKHLNRSQSRERNIPNDNYYTVISSEDENSLPGSSLRQKRAAVPMRVDWREKGAVGPVRDQGLCGACWAFSTVGAIEAMVAINTGKLNTLSVQEVIDCAGSGNTGCAGGDICLLLDWLVQTDTPVQPETAYPLKLTNGACVVKKNATGVRVKKYTCDDMVGSEEKLVETIATHGPVAVAVNALTWQNYLGGVIQFNCGGSPSELNHAVELVGYDLSADVPYYIAKNSWGKGFGNDGYLQLAIGSNICGLAVEVASVDISV